MKRLASRLNAPVEPVEAIGFDGDAIEAQGFAYLALQNDARAAAVAADDDRRQSAAQRRHPLARAEVD